MSTSLSSGIEVRRSAWRWSATLFFLALSAHAQESGASKPTESDNASAPIEVFKGPIPKKISSPSYPTNEIAQRNEGWVMVNFMIDPQGNPYQVVVTDSTGNNTFDKAAIRTVEKWTFEPASVDGNPIHSGLNYKLIFALEGVSRGANREFVTAYKQVVKAVDAGNRPLAEQELAKLTIRNLYEDAYAGLAFYRYYLRWGTESQQLAALKRAVAREHTAKYIPRELFRAALIELFPLYVRSNDFSSALTTWETMKTNGVDRTVLDKFEKTVIELRKIQKDARAYSVDGEITKSTSWSFVLFKRNFHVNVLSGRVAEIKLRCDKRFVFFPFKQDMQYKVEEKYGACSLELVGDEGSKFQLIQS